MKKNLLILVTLLLAAIHLNAQTEPDAGNWKTWFITSGKDYRLPPPPSYKMKLNSSFGSTKSRFGSLAAHYILECGCTRVPLA